MSLLRVPLELRQPGRIELDEASSRYVCRVHRLGKGDSFLAFDPERAVEAQAAIVEVGKRSVVCEVEGLQPARVVAKRPLWLLQGIGKGDKLDAVVRDATELGATNIVPICSARSIVKIFDDSSRLSRWKRIAVEASRQCGRGDCLCVHRAMGLEEAFALLPSDSLKLCLWECATESVRAHLVSLAPERAVCVLIGPEGGFSEEEAALAKGAGFELVSFGSFILRTETAATAVLGAVLSVGG
jgi:16S rRNA (uracil1498-N3)-methyltransferase